ncbi:hypothetical protein NMY22_g3454 [Coprinellus aureogranulatus]|nr:hypothetical protein NMY22_g3454 [Coprinellus aureogranulatus]
MAPPNIPAGHNQHDPEPDVLEATLLKYARQGLTIAKKLDRLERDHGLKIGKSKLNELERKYGVPTVRRPGKTQEELEDAIAEQVLKDEAMLRGPLSHKAILRNRLIMVKRKLVHNTMAVIAPEGFDIRFPGNVRKAKHPRRPNNSAGPYREVSADGYEKLNSQALRMGDISLPVYMYREKWSGAIAKLNFLPDSRTAAALGHVFLDLVEELKGVPVQMTTDKGPEVGWQYALQDALRSEYAPDLDPDTYPSFVMLKSVHNTVSEDLFYWVFIPVCQAELDEFKEYWNNHEIRYQDEKNMPSAHVPQDALDHPEAWGAENLLIEVEPHSIAELRAYLTEQVGPREEHLSWYSEDFANAAAEAYEDIGSPEITLESAWDVFQLMSEALPQFLEPVN